MRNPIYTAYEFLDATAFTSAAQVASGNFDLLNQSIMAPGLVRPDVMTTGATGLVLGVNLPAPFAVLFGSGVLSAAHGTLTNADTQIYAVNFSGTVPGSGTATVYLIASYASIQQNPYQVVGPPPGNPNFNASFIPFTAYATQVDSLALAASLTPADNSTTFELLRTTLAAGATGFGALDMRYQKLITGPPYKNTISVTSNKTLSVTDSGIVQRVDTAGIFLTLPPVASATGRIFIITTAANTITVQTVDGPIYGLVNQPDGYGAAAGTLDIGQSLTLLSDGFSWRSLAFAVPAPTLQRVVYTNVSGVQYVSVNGSSPTSIGATEFTWPSVTAITVTITGGGGGGASATSNVNNGTTDFSGGGGGAGATAIKRYSGVSPGTTIAVTVGNGGAAQNPGGNSVFGTVTASGGSGATFASGPNAPGAAGGLASGGDINIAGGYGSDGQNFGNVFPGNGGGSFWGGGGRAGFAIGGIAGQAYGAGGGGSYNTTGGPGGSGAPGIIIVEYLGWP